jgi:hypothetical protein
MSPDTDDLRSRAIEATIAQFDFTRVSAVAKEVGWTVSKRPSESRDVPTLEEMRVIARELLEQAWDDEEAPNCEFCHGGLRAFRTNGCLALQYVLEESYFIDALDS